MINKRILNGKIIEVVSENINNNKMITITRVWFNENAVYTTKETFPYTLEEYNTIKKEVIKNAKMFISLMASEAKEMVIGKNDESVIEPVAEETSKEEVKAVVLPEPDSELVEKLLSETNAPEDMVKKALIVVKNNYEEAIEYLQYYGFALKSKETALVVAAPREIEIVEETKNNNPSIIEMEPVQSYRAKTQPKNKKIGRKIVSFALTAAILVGAYTLVKDSTYNNQPTQGTTQDTTQETKPTVEIVEKTLVEHYITSDELVNESKRIANYLTSKGLKTDQKEVFTTLYLSNMTYFNQETIDQMTGKLGLLPGNAKTMIEDSLEFLAKIDTFNGQLVEKMTAENRKATISKLISLESFILSSEKDRKNVEYMEAQFTIMLNTTDKAQYKNLYMNTFDYFSGSENTTYPYSSNSGTIGGRYLEKTIGSQINQYSRHFMSEVYTKSFEKPITDLNNEIGYLNGCGIEFKSLTKK